MRYICRVLLADDEQTERMALIKRLKRHFCGSLDVSEAVNRVEALETFKREENQIVVMDISMSKMNGVGAAERVRSLDEDHIIIFLTAYDEFPYTRRATVIRTLGCLLRPCEKDELVAVMEGAIRLTDRRLNVPGVPSPGVSSPGIPSPDIPPPGVPSPDICRKERAETIPRDGRDGRLAQVTETIRKYIRNNYMKEISMQDAARIINYLGAYFCRLFKQCLDQNFTFYLVGFRVSEAKELLRDRSMGVKDVSMQVRYYDSSYFAKVFRRITGMIPSEYRDSETTQEQNRFFMHLCGDNQKKMGKDKIFFLYDKPLRYKIKAPGYIIKRVLGRCQKISASSG